MQSERRFAALCALAGGVLAISWSAIFVRWTKMPGVASAFYRMVIALPVLWAILAFEHRARRRVARRTLWIAVAGGVFFAGDVGFWNVAVMHTSAGDATFLSNVSPLFVGLFTWVVTRRLPSGRFWAALAVGLVGTCLIVTGDLRQALSRSSADGLAVVAAVCFALYLVITGQLRERVDAALLLAVSTTASAVTLLAWAVGGHVSLAVPGVGSWWALLALGLVCHRRIFWTDVCAGPSANAGDIDPVSDRCAVDGVIRVDDLRGEDVADRDCRRRAGGGGSLDCGAAGEGCDAGDGGVDSAGGAGLAARVSASAGRRGRLAGGGGPG